MTRTLLLTTLGLGLLGIACSSSDDGGASGGAGGSGAATGGVAASGNVPPVGGTATGGAGPMGGMPTGGVLPTGGVATGGLATGGATGGLATGGLATGGEFPTGGVGAGGVATGGVGAGGVATGGVGAGGVATGGVGAGGVATGGVGAGGTGTGGVTSTDVTVQLAQTRQTIDGFGINITWGTALTSDRADRLFNPDTGLGLTIVRLGMGENGDQLSNNIWGDMQMAEQHGATTFIGTLWSPPGRMKSDGTVNDGGYLLPEYYEEWSDTIAAFPGVVKQNTGIDLYAMSPQNETDFASCGMQEPCNGNYPTTIYTGQQYVDFFKVVAPKLRALNPPVRVLGPEASLWVHVWTNNTPCCTEPGGLPSSDPLNCGLDGSGCTDFDGYNYGYALASDQEAWGLLDILGTHQYEAQTGEPWPADVPDRKPVWQTEMSGVKWWPEQGPSDDIANGVAVAGWVHSALTVGEANAWLWWWEDAGSTNEGLLLNGNVTKRFYTYGNYTRFVRPGYTRVDITGEIPADVELTAFTGSGNTVIVAINRNGSAVDVPIYFAGGTAPSSLTPHLTSASADLAPQSAVTVSGDTFTASLPGTSVTTFVGQ